MTYLTASYLILFILTFNGLSNSASIIQNVMNELDMEKLLVNKFLMDEVNIVNTDMMEYKSDTPSADSLKSVKLWNPKEPIPIYVSKELSQESTTAIVNALNEIQSKSCLRFENAKIKYGGKGTLVYQDGSGCYSFLGKQARNQQIIFSNRGCNYTGTAIHETMHSLGFIHEHQRFDRDAYVKIIKDNIGKRFTSQFDKYSSQQENNLGPYDYGSIMHYGPDAFAKRKNLTTIQPLKEGIVLVNTYDRDKLSKLDAEKLNKLYDCASFNQTAYSPFVLRRYFK